MDSYIIKRGKQLRKGYTTGSCACAAATAGALLLLSKKYNDSILIKLPDGKDLSLEISDMILEKDSAKCSVIKDSGDDPDITNGIKIWAEVSLIREGVIIDGGVGVGRVIKPGLPRNIGEAAINPTPYKMIKDNILNIANKYKYFGGLKVIIHAENGLLIAKQTFNERLGIVDGISILGTTGIVEPMSEKALLDTIYLEIDSKLYNGSNALLFCIGNYGIDYAINQFGLDPDIIIKCSNYIGEVLDYSVYKSVKDILIIGHAGKLIKVAGGIMNTHSKISDCRLEILGVHAALLGASSSQVVNIMNCSTTDHGNMLLEEYGIKEQVWLSILNKIRFHLNYRVKGKISIEVVIFLNKDEIIIQSDGVNTLLEKIRSSFGKESL